MFDMIDVIQMTKISKHYLLEYQTLLDTYEMQAPNVTSGFRVLDFSDDISDDYTSDEWSMNESYSETSGDLSNSVQANLIVNPPEYSVSAGSKPLSIIIRRCNTPSAVCSSPVQEIDKENSCSNSNSAAPGPCDVSNLFICEEKEQSISNGVSENDVKWNNDEIINTNNGCNRDFAACENKKENLDCLSEIALCAKSEKEVKIVPDDDCSAEVIGNSQSHDAAFSEQNENCFIPVVPELSCLEKNSKNFNNLLSYSKEDNGKVSDGNVLDTTIQKFSGDISIVRESNNVNFSDSISCASVLMNSSSNFEGYDISLQKNQSYVKNYLDHSIQDISSNCDTDMFNHSLVKEQSNFSGDSAADNEVNSLTISLCLGKESTLNKNVATETSMKDQTSVCLGESSDFLTSEAVDRWQQLSCSPLLFSSDDESSSITEEVNRGIEAALAPSPQYNAVLSSEKKKVGKLQEMLMGAPPPPAVTMPLYSVSDMLDALKVSVDFTVKETAEHSYGTLVHWFQEAANMPWPQVKCLQHPGIHYNHGAVSEQFESLCQKLLARCVGAETASSVTIWSSFTLPAPRRERRSLSARRSGTGAPSGLSPGRRLSHLAKRHRTFSSAMLLNDGARLHSALPHVAPERRTFLVEGRKKESRRNRSSQKKKSNHHEKTQDVHTMKLNSSKRALFQSPTEEEKKSSVPSKFRPSSASAVRSRRALFVVETTDSQSKCPSTSVGDMPVASTSRKRSREDSEDEMCERLPRRRLFSDTESNTRLVTNEGNLRRPELSSTHKKKLLWAVAEALKKCGISLAHPQFRACATALASTCKGHVQEVLALRQGSTSDRLLQLALRFVDDVVAQHIKQPS